MNSKDVKELAKFLRYWSLRMSTLAGSGHPTSSLSAADLMATLIATTFRYDLKNPQNPGNDRLIFSKGHASPLYYSLFAAMGVLSPKDMEGYRKFGSMLEGHPTPKFRYTEAATGSLGQGLSIGVGEALALRMSAGPAAHVSQVSLQFHRDSALSNDSSHRRSEGGARLGKPSLASPADDLPRVFVLLGDGEMAEGSTWEAIEIASKYHIDNLVGILDVNRLGQSDETMLGWNVITYRRRLTAFGWNTLVINGHNTEEIMAAYSSIGKVKDQPYMIIAKTVKGKGVSFIEDVNGWHGKPLDEEGFKKAVEELGRVNLKMKVNVKSPSKLSVSNFQISNNPPAGGQKPNYKIGDQIATRKAYGQALAALGEKYPNLVALDGDVKNSTYSEIFKAKFPMRFFEMYIAEQNMAGAAVGMAKRGLIPFVSTFSAFLTRAYDQIRMGAISGANINFCGSHAGVSIGEDGPSQMGLEDLSMFRTIYGSTVLYPADAVATYKLVEEMINEDHIAYMRTTRPATAVIYGENERFPIGGSKVHRIEKAKMQKLSMRGKILIAAAGITLYEALAAQKELIKVGIEAIVVDCYSIKPLDGKTLRSLAKETGHVITVEDHWYEGGLGDAVLNELIDEPVNIKFEKLAVCKMPRSGKPQELLDFEGIAASSIVKTAKQIFK